MPLLLSLALKSIVVAGGALLLLRLMKQRSAADRSWIAHLGLLGLLLLPAAVLALPTLDVAGPAFLTNGSNSAIVAGSDVAPAREAAPAAASFRAEAQAGEPTAAARLGDRLARVDWVAGAYSAPAAILLLLTLIALSRLFLLKARASVLVEPHWLTALARAQHRMGFKHGTALLTSDALPSPISWGVVRPVILLNSKAAECHDEAEAIITHELAHVARLDWAKLLLARVATAVFWFNPLVWMLAREAHQLREEAADDAVLSADIDDVDYARLLVGVARHECRGLLLGAHGVAPAKNSLARRVKRVLDSATQRAPGGWRWTSAAAFFAAGMAVPVAALNLVPAATKPADALADAAPAKPYYVPAPAAAARPGAPLAATVAARSAEAEASTARDDSFDADDSDFDADVDVDADEVAATAVAAAGAARAGASAARAGAAAVRDSLDELMQGQPLGVTPRYAAAMRSSTPQLANAPMKDLIGMRIQGVTPDYVRGLERVGLRGLTARQIISARIQGVTPDYIGDLAEVGVTRLSINDAINMRMYGVTPEFVLRLKRAGYPRLAPRQLISLRIHGINPDGGDEDP